MLRVRVLMLLIREMYYGEQIWLIVHSLWITNIFVKTRCIYFVLLAAIDYALQL